MVDDFLPSYEMELFISSELMNTSFGKDERQVETNSDSYDNKCEFEVTKQDIYEEHQEVQNDLSKMIVIPGEELQFNKNQHGLRYEKGNNFHIPYYSKSVQFMSVGFFDENLKTPKVNKEVKNVDDIVDDKNIKQIPDKCYHCHIIGHMET
jgi:hypothetical protein